MYEVYDLHEDDKEDSMKTLQRIFALAGAALLAGLYIITLVLALMHSELAGALFRACFVFTILVPVLLYAMTLVYRLLKDGNKKENYHD